MQQKELTETTSKIQIKDKDSTHSKLRNQYLRPVSPKADIIRQPMWSNIKINDLRSNIKINDQLQPELIDRIVRVLIFMFMGFIIVKYVPESKLGDMEQMKIVLAMTVCFMFVNTYYPFVIISYQK